MSTITCPNCGEKHALFWEIQSVYKPILKYRCNKVRVIRKTGKKTGESRLSSETFILGYKNTPEVAKYDTKGIKEVWTKIKTQQTQSKLQPNLL